MAVALAVAGCGSSSPADAYLVEACGLLEKTDSGEWIAPPLSPSDTNWTIASPLTELEEAAEVWAESAIAATQAAREDSVYDNLRRTTVDISAMRNEVANWAKSDRQKHAQLRVSQLSTSDAFFQRGLQIEDRLVNGSPGYNDLIQAWKIECNVAVDELNG
jgi:hypothetical protein